MALHVRRFIVVPFLTLAPIIAAAQSAAFCPTITTYLTLHSRHPEVIVLKTFLSARGLLSGVRNTDYFGTATLAALKAWQRQQGIVAAGTPATTGYGATGPRTRAALASCRTTPAPLGMNPMAGSDAMLSRRLRLGSSDATTAGYVSRLQARLAVERLYDGLITGYFGPATELAVRRYQCRFAIVCDGTAETTGFGIVGPSTLRHLGLLENTATVTIPATTDLPGTACTLAGVTIPHGQSATFYDTATVPAGGTCASRGAARTCLDGVLSGASQHVQPRCLVQEPTLPTCSLSTNAATLVAGRPLTLSWSSNNSVAAFLSGPMGDAISVDITGTRAEVTTVGTPGASTYVLTVRNSAGASAQCAATVVLVRPTDITAPRLEFTLPASGARLAGSVTLAATASDDTTVAGVQFKLGGAPIGVEDTTSPYEIIWDSTTSGNGPQVLTAVARDAAGNTSSASRTITIANPTGAACTLAGVTIPHGHSATFYQRLTVPADQACEPQSRVCSNGSLSGNFTETSCSVLAVPTDSITTRGNQVLRNGAPFVAKGVIFEGFLEPVSWLQQCVAERVPRFEFCERHLASRDYLYGRGAFVGKDALKLAKSNWAVNAVRFNLNQNALDPQDPWYTPEYVDEVRDIVTLARNRGLIVFVALFSASNRNAPDLLLSRSPYMPLDTAVTRRAALKLGQMFGNDGGVIIELYNEPWMPVGNLAIGWDLWRNGGVANNPNSRFDGMTFAGVQPTVTALRAQGAKNAIVVQGIGASFAQFPQDIIDPQHKIIYSVHPFLVDGDPAEINWSARFGDFSATHPFIMTAWGAGMTGDPWCNRAGIETVYEYLHYLKDRSIGFLAYAFDVNFTITRNFQTNFDEPTQMSGSCEQTWGRTGGLVKRYFVTGELPPVPAQLPPAPAQLPPVVPTASPTPGTFPSGQTVSLTSAGADTIRYTRNSLTPPTCSTGSLYSEPLQVASTATIRAIACNSAGASEVAVLYYKIDGACTLAGVTVADGGSHTFYEMATVPAGQSCAAHAALRTCSAGALSEPMSHVHAACVTLPNPPGVPTASPTPGTFPSGQTVSLTSAGADTIRYTRNSLTPPTCSTGSLYSEPLQVASTATIRAIACNSAGASEVAVLYYKIAP